MMFTVASAGTIVIRFGSIVASTRVKLAMKSSVVSISVSLMIITLKQCLGCSMLNVARDVITLM